MAVRNYVKETKVGEREERQETNFRYAASVMNSNLSMPHVLLHLFTSSMARARFYPSGVTCFHEASRSLSSSVHVTDRDAEHP